MIRAEDVADLREGDVVELRFPSGSTIRGPLTTNESYGPGLGIPDVGWAVRDREGAPGWFTSLGATLTVVSRAPRPLYVNHSRTEPVQHDVVRDGEGVIRHCDAAGFGGKPTWWGFGNVAGCKWTHTTFPPQPLTLLVDGETGRCVP